MQRVTCPTCRTSASSASLFCGRCGQILPVLDGTLYAGKYKVEELLGQGGMGRVYRALVQNGRVQVAVKEIVDDRGWTDRERAVYLEAFQRESEVLGHLRVLRTVPALLVPYREWQGRRYFVMEFIEGKDLRRVIEERGSPFPVDVVVSWANQLCELLQVLHSQQPNPILHQDLTLENIILRRDGSSNTNVVLLDFGVARFVRMGTKLSVYAGKAGYAPKEQIVDRRPEPRSDLYSLAACVHHLLTCRDPTEPDHAPPFPPAHQLNHSVPRWLSDLIDINLSEEPRERYESAAKMREDLIGRRVTATIRCAGCGTENERSLIYCKRCAHTLLSTPRKCRHCAEFIPYNARYCPRCGQTV
jgi:serine/threonine-protein kinase